jgi:hypothetical protein
VPDLQRIMCRIRLYPSLVISERLRVLHKFKRNVWVSKLLVLLPVKANERIASFDESVMFDCESHRCFVDKIPSRFRVSTKIL